jgi:hypothetical protein
MSLCYDFQKWTMITLASVAISLSVRPAIQVVHGFVDGNNNGRDDVGEWENSSAYRLDAPYIDDDKNNRHLRCDIFHGSWNNTGDGSCTYTQGDKTCLLSTNLNLKCIPTDGK